MKITKLAVLIGNNQNVGYLIKAFEKDDFAMNCGLTEKLKKALTEMLFLALLEQQPMTIQEIAEQIDVKSGSACKVQKPYAVVYRMEESGYIRFFGKIKTPVRKMNYYEITETGKEYLASLLAEYRAYIDGAKRILDALSR